MTFDLEPEKPPEFVRRRPPGASEPIPSVAPPLGSLAAGETARPEVPQEPDVHRDNPEGRPMHNVDEPPTRPPEPTSDTPTRPRASVTIHHSDTHDTVTNRALPEQARAVADRVAEEVSNGIPGSWHPIPTDNPDKKYYTDSETNPTLFAKMRDGVSAAGFREKIEETMTHPDLNEPLKAATVTIIKAEHSVLNEMALAPEVGRLLLESETVQQLLQEHGYASISVVEPLVATVDRATGTKTVIYPWQEGYQIDPDEVPHTDPEYQALYTITQELEECLADHLILANDSSLAQVFVYTDSDGDKHLRVTDIDRFTRVRPGGA